MENTNAVVATTNMKSKIDVKDAHEMDKKIPQDLIILYQGKPYITKAGLEYKAASLFGVGSYGITTEIIDRQPDYVLAKATLKIKDGVEFTNFGEASKLNVPNPLMQKHLLHLAVTRAENRVIRMATACGYVSVDEMDFTENGEKVLPVSEKDGSSPTPAQLQTLKSLKIDKIPTTQLEAKQLISDAVKK